MKQNKILLTIIVCLALISFSAVSVSALESTVDLGTAGDFTILSQSGISTTGVTTITGDIGVSPIDSTAITGFGLIMDSSNEFSTSSMVTGQIYSADYTSPTSTKMTTAISDMKTAYTDAAGRSNPTATELGAGNIDGMTLAPGLYKWGTGVEIPNGVTLSGGANDIWIFQIAQDLTVGNGAIITLSNGAQAKNIFWQVAGQTTLGTTSDFKGIILSQTAISMNTGARLNGRALAQTAVTLDSNIVTEPTASSTTSTPTSPTNPTSPTPSTPTSADVECENWSPCSSNGIRTQVCYDSNGWIASTQAEACTSTTTTQTSINAIVENDIRSGVYTNSDDQTIRVMLVANDTKELRVNGVRAHTDLNITAKTDSQQKTIFTVWLRNGQEAEIRIMPDTASSNALAMLEVEMCSSENNCTFELNSVGTRSVEKIEYEMEIEKDSKIFGIFNKKMRVSAHVDAQTGETELSKPWWAFLAVEVNE